MKTFDYSVAPLAESAVVLAAGPSAKDNQEKLRQYISKNNSVVFAANYNYASLGVKSDYTFITDHRKFVELASTIDPASDIILRCNSYKLNKSIMHPLIQKMPHKFYFVGNNTQMSVYKSARVKVSSDGSYPYYTLGSAGFGCVLLAALCRPKKILIVGIDGPIEDGGTEKVKFDGSVADSNPKKEPKIFSYFQRSLFPTLYDWGIRVESFKSVRFYSLDRNKLHIHDVD